MYDGQIVFAQLMAFVPRRPFDTCVRRYHGQRRVRRFCCRDQFLCMAFAQLTGRESLRDIETCLRAMGPSVTLHRRREHFGRTIISSPRVIGLRWGDRSGDDSFA